ncbi:MAG TPA: histone deacetylase [Polyangiales bacterium]|jgi:acetoin utilization deacetylase AcuC-like enzyme|nr:histone deacetylase [Polyangiales bacterium]
MSAAQPQAKPIAIVDDPRFDAHEDGSGPHPERPERLAAARDGLYSVLDASPRVALAPREANDDELARIHVPAYVQRLRGALGGGYGHLDPDTYFCPATREAAWLAAGGGIDLALQLASDRSQRGFALLRPPGHHAVPARSMGFCLLNNIALAASAALASGLSRVAIVDWDVHHGNGTQDAFYDDPRVLFVSLHQYPFYPGTGAPSEIGRGKGAGYTANLALPAGAGPEAYGAAFQEVILPLLREYKPELVLVSAGFDAHARDPLAQMELDELCYGAFASSLLDLVDEFGHGRIGFVLEGGYDLNALSSSVGEVARAVTGKRTELPKGSLRAAEREAIAATRQHLAPYWPSVFTAS